MSKKLTVSISNEKIAWCVLLSILILAGMVRYRLLNVPLERDEGEYAYAAQLILQGVPPYQSVYSTKLPGTYLAYAAFLKIFGQTHRGVHWGLLVINAVTILLVFMLARNFIAPLGALIAAASFALLSTAQSVQGVFANAEHFVLPFSIGGIILTLRALREKRDWMFFVSGVFFGAGFLMKQHGFVFAGLGLFFIVANIFYFHPVKLREPSLQCLFLAAGVIAVYMALCLILAINGVFDNFWFWTVDYALKYITQVPLEYAWRYFSNNAGSIIRSAPFLWGLIGFGAISLSVRKDLRENRIYISLFVIFSFISVCPGLYFRPHYFILFLPVSALLAGVSIDTLQGILVCFPSRFFRYLILTLVISSCLGLSIYQNREFLFSMTPLQISRKTYGLNPFPESLQVAEFIKNRTRKGDRIAVLGSEPQLYFYSQRRAASSYIYMYPLMETHPFALEMQKEMIKQIEASRPAVVVFVNIPTSWLAHPGSHKTVFEWFNGYLSNGYKLVGVVEMFEQETVYHWTADMMWPPRSTFWIAVFERLL